LIDLKRLPVIFFFEEVKKKSSPGPGRGDDWLLLDLMKRSTFLHIDAGGSMP